jgi:uncharacterized protein
MANFVKAEFADRPLWAFFPLAFLLSWYPWLLSFFGVKASGMNPLGVLAAALIVAGVSGGWPRLKALLLRIVRLRFGWRWYAVALLLPVLFVGLSLAINLAAGAPLPTPEAWARWPEILDRFIFGILFVGLGEEPGWRGFALPELMRRRSALEAALILGVFWALWHLPLFGTEFAWNLVPAFLLSVFAGSVITAWLFNSSGQSVFITMLLHAGINAIGAGYAFRFFSGSDYLRLWWIYTLVWVAGALLVAWRTGPALEGFRAHAALPRCWP